MPEDGVGTGVRRKRLLARLTQEQLADRAGISVGALRDLEQGRTRAPRVEALAALARALGSDVDALMDLGGRVQISVLGPFEVHVDDRPVRFGSAQAIALALLALHANEYVHQIEIADYLWSDRRPDNYAALIHSTVARVRRKLSLGTQLASSRQRYSLAIPPRDVDALRLAMQSGTLDVEPAAAFVAALDQLTSWRGSVVEDLPELRHHPRVVALEQRRAQLVLEFADLALAANKAERAIPIVDDLARDEPLHEGIAARRVALLAAAGRSAEAHTVFRTTRQLLLDELGVDPSIQLIDAYREVLDREPPMRVRQAGLAPAQLPPGIPDFAGRAEDVQAISRYLVAERHPGTGPAVIAIAGIGGLGKTTLAVHAAHKVRTKYPAGQLFADLQGVGAHTVSVEQCLEQFLVALGYTRAGLPNTAEELTGLFRSATATGRFLFVLDNVKDTVQVAPLLPSGEQCGVIVTSRRRLTDLDGALQVRMTTFDADESLALLRSVVSHEVVDHESATAHRIAALCGGLPLALRLAAAQVAADPTGRLAPVQSRLERENERLDVLRSASRAVEACFELSYKELSPDVARTFRLLSLADGPDVCAEAASAATGIGVDVVERMLSQLVDDSMLSRRGRNRFAFHDLMRSFADRCTKGADPPEARRESLMRLLSWYLQMSRAATARAFPHRIAPSARWVDIHELSGQFAVVDAARDWLETERVNVLAAIQQAAHSGLHDHAWLLADAISGVFRMRQRSDEWLATASIGLAAAEAAKNAHGRVMMHDSLARGYAARADNGLAVHHYQQALSAAASLDWPEVEVSLLENLGNAFADLEQIADAEDAFAGALRLSRVAGARFWEAACLNDLGNVHLSRGDLSAAATSFRQALDINETVSGGQPNVNLGNLGVVAYLRGRYDDSWRYLQEARVLDEQASDPLLLGETLISLSDTALARSDATLAADYAREALALAQTIEVDALYSRALVASGRAQLASGSLLVATEQLERALDIARRTHTVAAQVAALLALSNLNRASDDLERCGRLAGEALALSRRISDRISEGLALLILADVAYHRNDPESAVRQVEAALNMFAVTGHRPGEEAGRALLESIAAGTVVRAASDALDARSHAPP